MGCHTTFFGGTLPELSLHWMQCLIRSLASVTVYLMSLVSLPLGSSILLSTTALSNAIKS